MTTIYVTMIHDRHTDTEAYLFSTPEKAIAFAQSVLDDNSESAAFVDPEDATLSPEELASSGLLFQGTYSTEGDCVWVLPRIVDEEAE